MSNALNDPLLLVGKIIAIFLQAVMAIGAVALLIAIPAILFAQGYIEAEIAKDAPEITGPFPALAIAAVMGVALAILAALFVFFGKLRRIIGTVGEGDPFQPENARRLSVMAWLMLAAQLLLIPAAGLGLYIAKWADQIEHSNITIDGAPDLSGILLVIILFILARVFRHGAAMREDLEGTV